MFEVTPIECGYEGFDRANRSEKEVARDITAHYEKVAKRGGQIIASHVLNNVEVAWVAGRIPYAADFRGVHHKPLHERATRGKQFLYLVAEFPDKTPETPDEVADQD